jgi:hypothetical protein
MYKIGCSILCIVALLQLQGCGANFNSIYREDRLAGNVDVKIADAKQRMIFGLQNGRGIFICPEASPDALSAGGTSLDVSGSQIGKLLSGFGLGASSAESTGSIGVRTQTITLLRELLTNTCLQRMGGPVDERYAESLRSIQVSALGMLAIEQLTGAVRAPPIIVNVGAERIAGKKDGAEGAPSELHIKLDATGKVEADGTQPRQSAELNQAVIEILKIVLAEGFNGKPCRDAKQKLVDANADPIKAAQAVRLSCPDLPSDEMLRLFGELSQDRAQAAANVLAPKDSSGLLGAALKRRVETLTPSEDKPLGGYRIKLFGCNATAPSSLQEMANKLKSLTTGTVAIEQLSDRAFTRRSGGLEAKKPLAAVFYDAAEEDVEEGFAQRLIRELQPVVDKSTNPKIRIALQPNKTDQPDTPFYLSAWLCF